LCRYGNDAGKFTEHVVQTAVGVAAASYNISNLGITVVARRAAADSVVAMGSPSSPSSESAAAAAVPSAETQSSKKAYTQAVSMQDSNVLPADNIDPLVDSVSTESQAVANVSATR